MSSTVLIVEDESRLAEILEGYLQRDGFRTEKAGDGKRALELWRAAQPDLVLLDIMLPHIDGLEVARRIRAESDVPIIMLTARDEEVDRLVGLGLGADDYVVKPYSPREVVARVKAVLRRTRGSLGADVLSADIFKVGNIEINMLAFEVRCHEHIVDMTHSEIKLLALLAKESNRVRHRSELLSVTGDIESFADERTIDAHIKNIRRKLGSCGEAIETVRGIGYKLRE